MVLRPAEGIHELEEVVFIIMEAICSPLDHLGKIVSTFTPSCRDVVLRMIQYLILEACQLQHAVLRRYPSQSMSPALQ